MPKGCEHAGKVVANRDSQTDAYFTEGGFALTAGTAIQPEQKNVVLLHEELAQKNGLSVGDTILLVDEEDAARRVKVTVQGIFTNTREQDSLGMASSCELYENVVFTDVTACSRLIYGKSGQCQYGDFYVNDPEELDSILDAVKRIPGFAWRECVMTKYDKDYQNAKAPLEALQNIVLTAMIVITGISLIILALLLAFRLRNRVREIGVLLAMGISKAAILLQQLTEVLAVAALSLALAFAASSLIAGQVGNSLLSQAAAAKYEAVSPAGGQTQKEDLSKSEVVLTKMNVSISAADYLLVWGGGILLCGAAMLLAIIPVLKRNPKNILSQLS